MNKHCSDYPDVECCGSCHSDAIYGEDEGMYPLHQMKLKSGDEAEVCCKVAEYLEKNGLGEGAK